MSEWISVKDRFPDNTCDILTYIPGEGCLVAFYSNGKWLPGENNIEAENYDGRACIEIISQKSIAHWMPLPNPPDEP